MTSGTTRPGEPAWSADELALLEAARRDSVPRHLQERMRSSLERGMARALEHGAGPPSASLRSSGLFGSKLMLWGTLSVLALGVLGFSYARRSPVTSRLDERRVQSAPLLAASDRVSLQKEQLLMAAGTDTSAVVDSPAQVSGAELPAAPAPPLAAPPVIRGRAPQQRGARASQLSPARNASEVDGRAASPQAHVAPDPGVKRQASAAAQSQDRSEPVPAPSDQLRLEAELLDGARRALGHGTLQQAAQLLDRYAAQFAHGVLRPESDVLRIELSMRRGDHDAANARATRFLAEYPNHPLRDRVRALSTER